VSTAAENDESSLYLYAWVRNASATNLSQSNALRIRTVDTEVTAYPRDIFEGNWSLQWTVLKMGAVCPNIIQQTGHFTVSHSAVGYDALHMSLSFAAQLASPKLLITGKIKM
jgi:hypothetical protein